MKIVKCNQVKYLILYIYFSCFLTNYSYINSFIEYIYIYISYFMRESIIRICRSSVFHYKSNGK